MNDLISFLKLYNFFLKHFFSFTKRLCKSLSSNIKSLIKIDICQGLITLVSKKLNYRICNKVMHIAIRKFN